MAYESDIQWFPGHMTKTRRLIEADLKLVDAVAEVVDCRIPESSRNPMINDIVGTKPRIIILNKCDQADDNITAEWRRFYEGRGIKTIVCDCRSGKGINRFLPVLKTELSELLERRRAKGTVGNSADGAGHVAIVESINADGSILTSESGYNHRVFYMTKRSGANWSQGAAYTYLGCIVNPAVKEATEVIPTGTIKKGDSGAAVKWMQTKLCMHGYLRSAEIDGSFGKITLGALLAFQFENRLEVDGVCGNKTKAKL